MISYKPRNVSLDFESDYILCFSCEKMRDIPEGINKQSPCENCNVNMATSGFREEGYQGEFYLSCYVVPTETDLRYMKLMPLKFSYEERKWASENYWRVHDG